MPKITNTNTAATNTNTAADTNTDTTAATNADDTNEAVDTNVNTASVEEANAASANTNAVVNAATNTNTPVTPTAAELQALQAQTAGTTLAPPTATQVSVNLSNPIAGSLTQWDMMLLLSFGAVSLLYGLSMGRRRTLVMLVSVYMALAITQAIPDVVLNVSLNNQFALQLSAFVGIGLLLFFVLSRSALLKMFGGDDDGGKWTQTVLFSLLFGGLVLTVSLSFIPPAWLLQFSPSVLQVFSNPWAQFGWIAAPVIAMIVIGRKK